MLALDHIVISANNPQQAAKDFGKKHEVTIIEGGKHANWGTYNYLAYFQNGCYIEWIGLFDKKIAVQSDNPLIEQLVKVLDDNIEGPFQYALRTDEMDTYTDHFQMSAIPYIGPIPGSRKRPDGSLLEWRMLFPKSNMEQLPFLIEWGDIKNTPQGNSLINQQQIYEISSTISDLNQFKTIFQTDLRLKNAKLNLSDKMAFSIDQS